jgi:hypothetical protein
MTKKNICCGILGFLLCFSIFAKEINKEIQIKDFNSVILECNANLYIKTGDQNRLTVKTDEKNLSKITAVRENNSLILSVQKQGKSSWDLMGVFAENKNIEFHLTAKSLNNITLTSNGNIILKSDIQNKKFSINSMGSGNIKCTNIKTENFKANIVGSGSIEIKSLSAANTANINSSGSGQLHLYKISTLNANMTASGSSTMNTRTIKADNINIIVLGSGTISIKGDVKQQHIKIDGTGKYYGSLLKSQTAIIKALGASNIEVNVTKELSVDIFGSAIVNIDGSPSIKSKKVCGSGAVIMQSIKETSD